jgi:hypothetical protein
MPAASVMLSLASLALATAPQQPASEQPFLVAQADGTWSITEEIHEQGPALAVATDGLLIDEEEWAEAEQAEREHREMLDDEDFERAFEEAVDAERQEPQP